MGVVLVGDTARLIGESVGGVQGILECTQTYSSGNQHQGSTRKSTMYLWEVGEMTESKPRAEQSRWHCSLLDPYPTHIDHKAAMWVAPPCGIPMALLLTM